MTLSSNRQEWIAYAAGCLISYAKRDTYVRENYNFLQPEWRSDCLSHSDFLDKLVEADVLGFSCYIWNQSINDDIAKKFKTINPEGIVLYGGPNVPEGESYQKEYEKERPWVDCFFTGPGEKTFTNYLKNGSTQKFVHGTQLESHELPNPYLDGIFDDVLSQIKNVSVAIETNRGCPYGCAFCDWGGQSQSKIKRFDVATVKQTISHLLSFPGVNRIEILDANYGIFKEDVEYVEHIIEEKKNKNKDNLLLTYAGFAKNGSPNVTKIMNLTLDNFNDKYRQVKVSFQSLDETVLKNIERKNISPTKLHDTVAGVKNAEISSELIIGLPGETLNSFIETFEKHIDMNISFARAYPLYVLPNTLMTNKEYKEKHKIKTKKIYLPTDLIYKKIDNNYNEYITSDKIKTKLSKVNLSEFTKFELIYESYSFNLKELTKIFSFWYWFNTFYNTGILKSQIKNNNKDLNEQYHSFIDNLKNMPFNKTLFLEYQNIVQHIYKPEDEIFIDNLKHLHWLHKNNARGNEVMKIYKYKELFEEEIKLLYPNFDTNHFSIIPDNKLHWLTESISTVDNFVL